MAFFYQMPGIGVVPTLASVTVAGMLEVAQEAAQQNRKRLAEQRKSIWDEDYHRQVRALIRQWYTDKIIQDATCNHVGVTFNPGKDILREVAVVYTHGAIRNLIGEDEEVQKAWNKLYDEDAIQQQSVFANRMAMLMGTVHVVPVCRKDRLFREVKLPNVIAVATDPSDPMGWPTSAIWEIHNGTNEHGQTDKRRVSHVMVDREAWHYLNRDGDHVPGPAGKSSAAHGAEDEYGDPACPVVPLALHDRTDDYWGTNIANRLHEGTVIVSALAARLSSVRSTQDHHLLAIRATSKEAVPGKQLAGGDPQRPLELFAAGAGGGIAQADLLATITDPVHHIRHIQFHVAAMARANGISDDAVQTDFAGDTPVMALKIRNEQRQALRAEQLDPIRRYERRLAVISCSVAKFARHPLAKRLPSPNVIAEAFELEVPDLSTIDDPDKRRNQDLFERKHGLSSIVDIARRDKWPNQPRSAVMELIVRNVKEDNELTKLLVTHGLAPIGEDPQAPGETADEVRGRVNGEDGPAVRDGDMPQGASETGDQAPAQPAAQAAGEVAPGTEVQKEALNGAQVDALLAIIERVARGEMPKATAAQVLLVAFPGVITDLAAAQVLLADVEEGSVKDPEKQPKPDGFGKTAPPDGGAEEE